MVKADSGKKADVSVVQRRFFKVNKKFLKVGFCVVVFFIFLILIWGQFYGVSKVRWPKEKLPVFPEKEYKSASEYYKSVEKATFIGKEDIQKIISDILDAESIGREPLDRVFRNLNEKYEDKFIIFRNISESIVTDVLEKRSKELIKMYTFKKDSLEMNTTYKNSTYRRKHRSLTAQLQSYNGIYKFLNYCSITPQVLHKNEFIEDWDSFEIVAGPFGAFTQGEKENQYVYQSEKGKTVVKKDFLKKAGLSKSELKDIKLKSDEKKFKEIKKKHKNKFNEERKKIKEEIGKEIGSKRKAIRSDFYGRWYATLILAVVTIFMLSVLNWYYAIIRRKGLPKRSTHEIYFATNMTSLILRWFSLVIVIFGMIQLLLDLFFIVFKFHSFGYANIFGYFGFVYAFLAPILTTVSVIVFSWFIVLDSEFICFLSNCYHVLFVKAVGEPEKLKKG
jgi:hypothetical protein